MAEKITEYSVTVTQTAEDDLDEIVLYIAENNPQIALKVLNKLQNKINTLKYFPERGRKVPELLDKNIKCDMLRITCLYMLYRLRRFGLRKTAV